MLISTVLHAQLLEGADSAVLPARGVVFSQLLSELNESLPSTQFRFTDGEQKQHCADDPDLRSRPYNVLLNTLHSGGSMRERLHLEDTLRWLTTKPLESSVLPALRWWHVKRRFAIPAAARGGLALTDGLGLGLPSDDDLRSAQDEFVA